VGIYYLLVVLLFFVHTSFAAAAGAIMPLVSVSQRKEDGTPLLGLGEEVILALPNEVECHFDPAGPSEGAGSLFVTSKNVIWLSSSQVRPSFPLSLSLPPSLPDPQPHQTLPMIYSL
jgi:hypothetical protein